MALIITSKKHGNIKINGGSLYYQAFGNGNPIIVLHGGPGLDQNYLLPQMLELAKNNEVTFYDQRGSGKSIQQVANEEICKIEIFINDLEIVRHHLGYEQFTLIGYSWGGLLAM